MKRVREARNAVARGGGVRRGSEGPVGSSSLTIWRDDIVREATTYEENLQEMALLQMKYFIKSYGKQKLIRIYHRNIPIL